MKYAITAVALFWAISAIGGEDKEESRIEGKMHIRDLPRGWCSLTFTFGERTYSYVVQPCDFVKRKDGMFKDGVRVVLYKGVIAAQDSANNNFVLKIDGDQDVTGRVFYSAEHRLWAFLSDTFLKKFPSEDVNALAGLPQPPAARKREEPKPREDREETTARQLAAHWQTVRVQVKPEQPTLSFNFECDAKNIYWTATASNGSVDYRSYDILFFNGNTIVDERILILDKLKRGQAKEGSAFIDPLTVTRIDVRLRKL